VRKRNKTYIIFPSSVCEDKLHVHIKDKHFTGNIELSKEGLNQLKELLNE
jgi:hypothetical protein